jgi:hypothetical protein
MAATRINIFLSYASEDQRLAEAIASGLDNAFKYGIDLKHMSLFQPGVNYRTLIDQALDEADVLLVVATGKEKLAHSFTGYEVGYFRRSMVNRKYIDERQRMERMIIPIALSADIPDTLSDIQGVGIARDDLFFFGLQPDGSIKGQRKDPLSDLFLRVYDVLEGIAPDDGMRRRDRAALKAEYVAQAASLYRQLVDLMSTLPVRRSFPKTRIRLRLPPAASAGLEIDDRVSLACDGPTVGMFQSNQSQDVQPWSEFAKRIGPDDIVWMWSDALRSLITSNLTDEVTEADQLVFSYDEKKLFRLFVARSTDFYDGSRELDIYVVEVYRQKDVGDPFTTYLGKAIDIALRYRSLFLERASPYGPRLLHYSLPHEWKNQIRHLVRELRLILLKSRESGLGDRTHVAHVFGEGDSAAGDEANAMLAMAAEWEKLKDQLYRAASEALAAPEATDEVRRRFLKVLTDFCDQTRKMNVAYINKLMKWLQLAIQDEPGDSQGSVSARVRAA